MESPVKYGPEKCEDDDSEERDGSGEGHRGGIVKTERRNSDVGGERK
jgi:hypothetical protein